MPFSRQAMRAGPAGRNGIPPVMLVGVWVPVVLTWNCLAGPGTGFVNIAYPWQDYAGARDVVVDASGHAWFVGERAHVFHYDLATGVYELQNDVSINDASLVYTSIDIHDNSRKLIVVGHGGVWESELPPLPDPDVADFAYNGSIRLEFDSIPGIDYLLQCSVDLVTWTDKDFMIRGFGQTETIIWPDGFASNEFYRIIIAE